MTRMVTGRLNLRNRRIVLAAMVFLLLTPLGFIAPLSYVPNPLGLYYLISGGYEYQPDSRAINRFALLGSVDPQAKLIPQLDALLGKTGLDPLDPIQPLASYRIVSILNHPRGLNFESAAATIEFRYADGTALSYQIPVYDRVLPHEDRSRWRFSGLGRPLAINEELPWLPFPTTQTAISLGEPKRLRIEIEEPIASGPYWSAAYLGWGNWGGAVQPLPDGKAFLVLRPKHDSIGAFSTTLLPEPAILWLVSTAGAPARRLDSDVRQASADVTGRFIAYTRWRDPRRQEQGYHVTIYDREANTRRTVGRTDSPQVTIADNTLYFLNNSVLSEVELAAGTVRETLTLGDAAIVPTLRTPTALAISPAGDRLAYRCLIDLCLIDPGGRNMQRIPLNYPIPAGTQISPWRYESFGVRWSTDGQRLAVTIVGCCTGGANTPYATPKLLIVERSGRILQEFALGPDGALGEPQWTPDGRFVFVNAFPRGGRRIVAIDTAGGQVADLSQPGWDAYFGLAPDGSSLLLWNARGGFWSVPLLRR